MLLPVIAFPSLTLAAALGSSALLATRASCETMERTVARQLAAEHTRLTKGGSETDSPLIDLVPLHRTCYGERVRPALVHATTSTRFAEVDEGIEGYFGWARSVQLLGADEEFAAEQREGNELVLTASRHLYRLARDRCTSRRDAEAAKRMFLAARFLALVDDEETLAGFDTAVSKCLAGTWYRVTRHDRFVTGTHGPTWDVTYDAYLWQMPGAEIGDLAGVGRYRGTIRGSVGEPDARGCYTQLASYPVGGRLEAEGAAAGGGDVPVFLVARLTTTDWLYGGSGPNPVGKFVALVGVPGDTVDVSRGAGAGVRLSLTGKSTRDRKSIDHGSHKCTGSREFTSETTVVEPR